MNNFSETFLKNYALANFIAISKLVQTSISYSNFAQTVLYIELKCNSTVRINNMQCRSQSTAGSSFAQTFSLLEQKGQRVERVRELSWSPTESTLAFWAEERPDVPARVVIQSIELTAPSATAPGVPQFLRKELRSSNLFEVADVAFHWHRSGDYLCVRVSRYAKKTVKKDAATGTDSIKYLVS